MRRQRIKQLLKMLFLDRLVAQIQRLYFGLGSVGSFTRISPNASFRGFTRNIHVGGNCVVESGAILESTCSQSRIEIGAYSLIATGAMLQTGQGGEIKSGSHLSVNPYSIVYGHGGTFLGNHVRIAAHCVIIPANHVFVDPDTPITYQGLSTEGIHIGNDVWLGAGVRVLDGIVIGDGCVVGAGSVVTKSLPPYSVAVGVPAKWVKERTK